MAKAIPNTIEVKFIGDSSGLTKAIRSLDAATKSLVKAQVSQANAGKKKISVDKANLNSLRKLNIELKLQGKNLKAVKIDTNLYKQALKGNRLAMAKVNAATKAYILGLSLTRKGLFATSHATRLLSGSFAVLRSKLLLIAFATLLVKNTIGKLVTSQGEQELAEKKLSSAIGRRSTALLKFASIQQKVTVFGDEETITAMSLIGAYTDSEKQIKALTKASMDLASAKGMDLATATDLVAKSVFSSTNALSRYGVVVEGTVGSTGRLEMATKSLARMYGGQAKAQAKTMTGSLKQAGAAAGDSAEAIGRFLSPAIIRISKNFRGAAEAVTSYLDELRLSNKELKDIVDTEIRESVILAKITKAKKQLAALETGSTGGMLFTKTKIKEITGLEEQLALTRQLNFWEFTDEQKQKNAALDTEAARVQMIAKWIADQKTAEPFDALEATRQSNIAFQADFDETLGLFGDYKEDVNFINDLIEKQGELYKDNKKVLDSLNTTIDPSVANMKKLAEFSAKSASAFMTSALMGDSLKESIKRSIVQMLVMVVQAKLLAYFTEKAKENMEDIATGGGSAVFRGIKKVADFLFGHEGGEVTANGIKRFHAGGLANDEVPAVLQQGEFVLSKQAVDTIGLGAVRSMNEGGGGAVTNVYIQGGIVQEDYIRNELIPAIHRSGVRVA